MTRQAIQDSVDFYVDTSADLTALIEDLRLADGTRAWVSGAGSAHGLWCLDQTSVLPLGPNVVATQSTVGRWIYFGSGVVPPPPPVAGFPYEFIYRPLEPVPAGNVYNNWALLVAAAAMTFGQKLVYFDDSLAPCSIPTGVWDLGSSTIFTGDVGRPSVSGPSPSPTPLTIDDGAVLQHVFEFKSLDITSNSKSPVNTAPFPGARYTFSGTTRVLQTDPAGEFVRSSTGFVFSPVEVILLESAKFLTGGGPVVNVTNPGANASVYALDDSLVQPDTIAAAALTVAGFTVDSASIAIAQAGVPGGILPVTLLSAAARVSYDDTLVPPLLGANEVQAAIDALKSGGLPLPGAPNAILYENPLGTGATTDANLTAFPVDAFGRPQIWDKRVGGAGAVYRNGSWTADGDPTDVTGDGLVSYGANAIGLGPNATDGGYARIKPNRFGLAQVIGGGPLTYAWRVDYTQMILRDDLGAEKFSIDRATGNTFIAENARLFMGNNGVLHGSAARIQLSSTIANAAQLRGYQYGANAASAGITTFKSRGATIGTLGAVLPGDLVGRWTSIGIPANGASLNLSALISVQVPTAYVPVITDAFLPTEFEIALVPIAATSGTRPVFKVSSEGEAQSLFSPTTTQAGYATYALLGDAFPMSKLSGDAATPGGYVVMGAGGASAPDTRIRRIAPSGGVPQVVIDDDGFAAGAVNVIPGADAISKIGTRSVADGGTDPVSKRWAEVNTVLLNTGDLNLIDEKKDAHWTIVEERDRILVLNRKTGKRYTMALTPLEEEEE